MIKTKPKDYQWEGVYQLRDWGLRGLLADDMGLGKTYQALLAAFKFLPDEPPGPIVITCPAHLKIHWQREARKHLGVRVEILGGEKVPVGKPMPLDPNQAYVINYEVLEQPRAREGQPLPDPERSWVNWLRNLRPRLVVGDEAHYVKNRASGRSTAFRQLCRGVPHILLLTGTPVTNRPADLWPLLNILKPEQFDSQFAFNCEYAIPIKQFGKFRFIGSRNLEQLHDILRGSCMVRRLKRDVLKELPLKQQTVIPMEVDLKEYREAEDDFLGYLKRTEGEHAAIKAGRAEEMTRMNYLRRLAGQLKINAVIKWVEDFFENTDSKLLLGALHKKVTYPLMDKFGDRAVLVDGDLDHEDKQAAFDKFNLDPQCALMVGNEDAAGTGWSCRSTSTIAVCELPWRPDQLAQFIARIEGLERGLPGTAAQIYYLIAEGTIEEDLCQVLHRKQRMAEEALDGGREVDETTVYDLVREMTKQRAEQRRREKKK